MNQRQNGFTIIELIICITIIAILLTIALPSFSNLLIENKVSSQVQKLTQTLQLSRTRAITNNIRVTICPIDKSTTCSKDWSTGYMSFIDINGDRQYNENDTIIFQHTENNKKITLNWRAFGHKRSLQWLATGITNHQNGSFEFCYEGSPKKSRALFITKAGRIRFSKDTDGDEFHENSKGGVITC